MVVISIIIFTITILPIFIRMDDSVNLGSKYRYIQDYPQTIIYHETEEYKGVGTEIVLPVVLKYAYNKDFIIAETDDLETKDTLYWIVDKKTGWHEKYDSLSFVKELKLRKIDLIFPVHTDMQNK